VPTSNSKNSENKPNVNELQWYSYFKRQFAEHDAKMYDKFESKLND
jgi:hypothetical protein